MYKKEQAARDAATKDRKDTAREAKEDAARAAKGKGKAVVQGELQMLCGWPLGPLKFRDASLCDNSSPAADGAC